MSIAVRQRWRGPPGVGYDRQIAGSQGSVVVKVIIRSAAVLLAIAGIVLAFIYRHEIDAMAVRDLVASNPFAPIVFIALQVAASLLFVPRTVLGLAAGLLFGLVWGSVLAIVGAVAGAAAGFALVRWLGARGTLDMTPAVGKLVERAEKGGWRAVAIVRLAPLPHSLANTALALTNISWRDYLVGSFVGMLPMTVVLADIGASGGAAMKGKSGWTLACLLLAFAIAATLLIKRHIRKIQD